VNKIYIIGSGPIGVICASYLLEKGNKVVIIDNSDTQNKNNKLQNLIYKNSEKTFISDFFITKKNDREILPASSKNIGGFSNIWGGTLSIYDDYDFDGWEQQNKDFLEYYRYIIDKLKLELSIDDNLKFMKSKKYETDNIFFSILDQINKKKEKLANRNIAINESILFMVNNKIWSSSDLLEELKITFPDDLEHITNLEITNIEESDKGINLHSKTQVIHVNNTKVFVATGPFSSAYLSTKLLKKNQFSIRDSQLKIMPFFWFGRNVKEKSNKTYPQLFLDIKNLNSKTIRCQLYSLNKNLINSLGQDKVYLKIGLKILSKVFNNRIFLAFVYSHSDNSEYFTFDIKQDGIFFNSVRKNKSIEFNTVFKKMILSFRHTKLLPMPVFKTFKPYESFHYGASSPLIKECTDFGQISDTSNIHFIDSSIFRNIPSGPITFTSMAVALKIVSDVT
jgi:hypothetical protein